MKRRWHKVDAEKTKCREVLIPQPLEMTRNGGKPDRRSTLIQDQGRDTTAYNNNKREIHCEGRIEENFSSCKRDTCYCTACPNHNLKYHEAAVTRTAVETAAEHLFMQFTISLIAHTLTY